MVLLVTAVLFVRSLANARGVDPGFDVERLVTLTVAPAMAGYTPDSAMHYLQRVLAAAEAIPGVRRATYHAVPIATGLISQTTISAPSFVAPAEEVVIGQNRVGPRFAETLGLHLIAGRDVMAGDEASSHLALVNERFVRHVYRDLDVVGRTFSAGGQEYSIIGVVSDAHDRSVVQPTESWMYIPATAAEPRMRLTVQTVEGGFPVAALERAVQAVDPAVPVFGVSAVSAQIADTLRRERLLATLGSAFGSLALGLVTIGVYATFSGYVSRRSREIGIRMAIGADAGRIARLLAREALVLALWGLGAGLVAASATGSIIRSQLFNLEPTDSRAFATAAAVLFGAIAIAVCMPARRAVAIEPAQTLRAE